MCINFLKRVYWSKTLKNMNEYYLSSSTITQKLMNKIYKKEKKTMYGYGLEMNSYARNYSSIRALLFIFMQSFFILNFCIMVEDDKKYPLYFKNVFLYNFKGGSEG